MHLAESWALQNKVPPLEMALSFATGTAHGVRQPWSRWHHRLHKYLLELPHLLPPGASLLLAVSGGQDSLCLLRLLLDLQPLHLWSLHVFHGDHGCRHDSSANADHVHSLCHGWGLPCHMAVATQLTSEAAARQWRYDTAAQLCQQLACSHLVTGHTATDRAETMLFHLCRGTGSRGLGSLRSQRQLAPDLQLIRPLLSFSRQDTLQCCQDLHLPFWEDYTNGDQRLSRNHIRSQVIPSLEQLNGDAVVHMAACSEQLAEESDFLDQLAHANLHSLGGVLATGLSCQSLAALPKPLARRCLALWIQTRTGFHATRQQLKQLMGVLTQSQAITVTLKHGWCLQRQGGTLLLAKRED